MSRLVVFLLLAGAIALGLRSGAEVAAAWWIVAASLAVGFLYLVRMQRAAEEARVRASELARLNREAGARVDRFWALLPSADFPDGASPPIARDLGLFGPGSLFQLLCTAWTPVGKRMLASWLIDPAPPEVVRTRQDAARELAGLLDLRQEMARSARRTPAMTRTVESFCGWAEQSALLPSRSPHVLLARALPALLVLLALGHGFGILPPLWILLLPLNALVWIASARRFGAELTGVELRAEALASFEVLFAQAERSRFEADRLVHLQGVLTPDGVAASARLRRLRRIATLAEVRYSPMLYIPLQLFFLWDTHVLRSMDGWRRDSGRLARGWLRAIGEIEALSALGGLTFDNPDWAFPEIDRAATRWEAERLAHPLLPPDRAVPNDLSLGPAGTFLLVTGSNMSGKSTLLRAIGINVTLAHAGGPVCAAHLVMPPTRLGTSFVIEDSLQDGVSFFMAELRRLSTIVNESRAGEAEGEWRYLFLLDEILRGTNSGERQIAVRRILSLLLANGACGAISSHDLDLADAPALRERSLAVHFREHYDNRNGPPRMAFDYLLREGIADTSNALALLEMMGIGEGPAES